MNPFQKFDITHVSPSSVNLFEACPSAWVARYLLGRRVKANPAMVRGTLVEEAVMNTLYHGRSVKESTGIAIADYDKRFPFPLDRKIQKEREALPDFITQSVKALQKEGAPTYGNADKKVSQIKVEKMLELDDYSILMIGYLDFWYPDKGRVIDLKTTHRVPNSMSVAHRRQQAFYANCMSNHDVRFCYVSTKKYAEFNNPDVRADIASTKVQVARMGRFLDSCDSVAHAVAMVPVDPSSFYWRNDIDYRVDTFGI